MLDSLRHVRIDIRTERVGWQPLRRSSAAWCPHWVLRLKMNCTGMFLRSWKLLYLSGLPKNRAGNDKTRRSFPRRVLFVQFGAGGGPGGSGPATL